MFFSIRQYGFAIQGEQVLVKETGKYHIIVQQVVSTYA